jgi:uncharacterized protein YndB with AHSA1/START domain
MNSEILSTTPETEIVSSRVFNFPIAKVFKAWEDPEHLKQWWGPKGFTNTFHEFDFRVGGHWKLTMHGPEKGNYENHAEFIRIEKPNLIYWKRHSQPLFHILATFEAVGADKTKLVFKMLFGTSKECDKIRPFAPEKNEENFDRLEVVLGEMP